MTKTDAKQWLNLFSDTPDDLRQPCRHGHKECSTTHHGDCLDEVITASIYPEDETQAK